MTDEKRTDEEVVEQENLAPEEAAVEQEVLIEEDDLAEKVAQLEAELNDAKIRAAAEMQNIRRRADQDVEKAHKFALDKFAGDLLPVVDALERGLSMTSADDEASRAVREGMEQTLKLFLDTLKRHHIEQINPVGEPFNPEQHNAVAMQPSAEMEPNSVLTVFQPGYLLNGRVMRPAMVVVSQAV